VSSEVLHVVGARPNFPKAGPVLAALDRIGLHQILVHTGQHYDDRLSESFFRDLKLPRPDINLGVGSGTHAQQTAAIMVGMESVLLDRKPDLLVVYGDVNSTIAAALVAAKLGIPVAHVEAGLRSFDREMPEEINRILTDQLSELLFTTSPEAFDHLMREGIEAGRIHFVGNPMIDTLVASEAHFDQVDAQKRLGLPTHYIVATLHRPSNVDEPNSAKELVGLLKEAAQRHPVVIPLHPRGRALLEAAGLSADHRIHVLDPLGYLDFMSVVSGAHAVITDSGGVQEETTYLGVPCLTIRTTTERPITITHGTNILVSPTTLVSELDRALARQDAPSGAQRVVPPLWDGHASDRIATVIDGWLLERSGQPD
jgi:UDP-N-acetylglucosamine 2-epimerase (non-hydrolysing)